MDFMFIKTWGTRGVVGEASMSCKAKRVAQGALVVEASTTKQQKQR
jgi:hypothetical protein